MGCNPRVLRMMRWTERHDKTPRYSYYAWRRSGSLLTNKSERICRSRDLNTRLPGGWCAPHRVHSAQLQTSRRCDIVWRMTATADIQTPCKKQPQGKTMLLGLAARALCMVSH